MDGTAHHRRARTAGVNLVVYWLIRIPLQLFFWVYLRMSRIGREYFPKQGPAIIASNHRSFFDPFIIGTMTRRPMYYVAKHELFELSPVLSWLLTSLGAFPVDRGRGDQDTIATAKQLLARGELVLIFPEGTRTRPGPLGRPRRGVGRLALETGAPVIPVAIIGTEAIRRGIRLRPHKVRVRAGAQVRVPHVEIATPAAASTVADRVWACVSLQWAWLGGAVEPVPETVPEIVHAA
jgi:glycerol-3-phosphate dehydrogenase (NAD(P)+)